MKEHLRSYSESTVTVKDMEKDMTPPVVQKFDKQIVHAVPLEQTVKKDANLSVYSVANNDVLLAAFDVLK